MVMLMLPMAISGMAKIAIMAILAIIAMANGIFYMVIRDIQLKSTQETSSVVLDSIQK